MRSSPVLSLKVIERRVKRGNGRDTGKLELLKIMKFSTSHHIYLLLGDVSCFISSSAEGRGRGGNGKKVLGSVPASVPISNTMNISFDA